MKPEWMKTCKRLLAVALLLPSMAMSCDQPVDAIQPLLDRIDPDANVDPDSVTPPDPSDQPTGRYRSIDGTGNHMDLFTLGAADTTLRRMMAMDYADSVASMGGAGRPSPREISNALCADSQPGPNGLGASDFLWQWGQFVDHDHDARRAWPDAAGSPAFERGIAALHDRHDLGQQVLGVLDLGGHRSEQMGQVPIGGKRDPLGIDECEA